MRPLAVLGLFLIVISAVYVFLPDKERLYKTAAAEVKKELSFRLGELKGKIPGADLLQNVLGLASNLPRLGKLAEEMPKNAGAVAETLLPLVQEVLTNTQKEEIYLKAPLSVTLPEVKIENYDQQLSVPLEAFEIKDTRRTGKPWILAVTIRDLVGEKGVIIKENIRFRLRAEDIESGGTDQLAIEDGFQARVAPAPGQGKGVYKIKPWLVINIPQGSYSGSYQAKIESALE